MQVTTVILVPGPVTVQGIVIVEYHQEMTSLVVEIDSATKVSSSHFSYSKKLMNKSIDSAVDSRSNRLPPALNPPMMSVAGQALGGMFSSQSGSSLSAMVQNMPSMAAAERSYIHSIRRF